MDDPTICVGTFSGLMEEIVRKIEAGQNEDNIVKELRKSIFEARLKSEENPSFFIMTINMHGPSSGKGTAMKRRKLLSVILELFPSAIIFCQELPGRFEKEVVPDGYKCVKNGDQVAIIWATEHFKGSAEGLKTSDTKITKIREEILGKISNDGSELLSRISMVKLTAQHGPAKSMLAVSYHGPYRRLTDEKKKAVFKNLLAFLDKVIEDCGIYSYIIGGDFNFNTLDVNLPCNVVMPSYELTPRSEKDGKIPYKDNFLYWPHGILQVRWLRAIRLENEKTAASDMPQPVIEEVNDFMKGETESKVEDMLDHDCLVGVLVSVAEKAEDVKNLTTDFKDMAMSDRSNDAETSSTRQLKKMSNKSKTRETSTPRQLEKQSNKSKTRETSTPSVTMDSNLRTRVSKFGYRMRYNPPGDGNCFYAAAAYQLSVNAEDVKRKVFDHLEQHQFDEDGQDRLKFISNADIGCEVPSSWTEALKLLEQNYANEMVVRVFSDVFKRTLKIVTVHGPEDACVKDLKPRGKSGGTLHFGHTGIHYVVLEPIVNKGE